MRFVPFYDYMASVHKYGGPDVDIPRGKWSKKINLEQHKISLEKWRNIKDEIYDKYPKIKIKDELELEKRYGTEEDEVYVDEKKSPIKEKSSKSGGFDPFFFIPDNAFGGFLILLFLTWLIFSVIFDIGTDLGPPRFFGHDGG